MSEIATFTPESLAKFKAIYNKKKEGSSAVVFEFEGKEYTVAEAKYLIEYHENNIK